MKTYYHEYAHLNHAKWLEGHLRGVTISPIGKKVANLLGYVGGGLYNCPVKLNKVDWSHDFVITIVWSGTMANWDGFALTRLWVLCARLGLRVEIDAAAPGRLEISFWQREGREGGVSERLPDCEALIRDVDDDFLGE